MTPPETIALSRAFCQAMREPLFLCTAMVAGKPNGCVVTQVVQLSYSDTPLMGIALGKENLTCAMVCDAKRFGLSYLGLEQIAIAERFGLRSGREMEKFAGLDWQEQSSVPLLVDAPGWAVLQVRSQIDVETHLLFIAKLEAVVPPMVPVLDRDALLHASPAVANRSDPWERLPTALHSGTLRVWC